MPLQTSDDDKDFSTAIRELIDLSPEDVATRLELLDADEVLDLMDAVTKKDRVRAAEIVKKATDATTQKLSAAMGGNGPTTSSPTASQQKSNQGVTYSIGDKVNVGDKEGVVRIPNGPRDTIGVVIDGKVKMFDRDKVQRLAESEEAAGMGALSIADLLAAVRGSARPYPKTFEVTDYDPSSTDRLRSLAGLPATPQVAAKCGMDDTVYLEVQPAVDPAEAARTALSAIETLAQVLPHVRLADLKVIRASIVTTLNAMNENAAARRMNRI